MQFEIKGHKYFLTEDEGRWYLMALGAEGIQGMEVRDDGATAAERSVLVLEPEAAKVVN